MVECTLIVFKRDSVERGLVGEILNRFEKIGLRVLASKTAKVGPEFVAMHYPDKEDYLKSVGEKTLESYAKEGIDPRDFFGTTDSLKIGQQIRKWNMDYLSTGPVLALVLEGNRAVELVRKIVGKTDPSGSNPGSIRGDYSSDSIDIANRQRRAVRNLIHASSSVEEAEEEIKLWFTEKELVRPIH